MNYPLPLQRRDWFAAPLLGAALGLPVLGVGSRLGMRLIAVQSGLTPGFTFGGTVTVLFLGAASGAAAGLILVAVRRLFPRSVAARVLLYWIAILSLTFRGLRPVDESRLLVFLPLMIAFAGMLQWWWGHRYLAGRLRRTPGLGYSGGC